MEGILALTKKNLKFSNLQHSVSFASVDDLFW